jgi:type I restriction-modification system DNA methylase subunit
MAFFWTVRPAFQCVAEGNEAGIDGAGFEAHSCAVPVESGKEQFFDKLEGLIAEARRLKVRGFGEQEPEAATCHELILPLLDALGFRKENIKPEFKILGDSVDYLLESDRPLLFLEAKGLPDCPDKSLFDKHSEQVLGYIQKYRLSPEITKMEQPVKWILLTNFAQIHLIRVNEITPSFSFKLDELWPRRAELWELLALENVEAGRIDELYDQHRKAGLDQMFLADLKRWRLLIANGFAMSNRRRSLEEITLASQQLLDRFIFCRMLETRWLVEYNKLARTYSHYEILYARADKTFGEILRESLFVEIKNDFNTELFEQPLLCDELEIDNAVLSAVIGHGPLGPELAAQCGFETGQGELLAFRHLYRYDFSLMSQDVMGAVYERFLAHKLIQDGGRVVIEDTDELRKKEGIYYTPQYIVDYIVAHTLGEKINPILAESKALLGYRNFKGALAKIRELSQVKVLDPAMGSGSFLLRAFDALVKAYDDYNEGCRRLKKERNGAGALFDADFVTAEEVLEAPLHVLTENIFGVDLDKQAVEVAKLSLWLRYMAVNRDAFIDRLRRKPRGGKPLALLPNLTANLKRGNSLIADAKVAGDVAFDWAKEFPETMKRGGFDVVIGNPPYVLLQDEFRDESQVAFLRANFKVASYKIDTYHLFMERGISLAKPGGFCGMITPANFLTNNFLAGLRRFLIEQSKIEHILVIDEGVFEAISVDNAIFVVRSGEKTSNDFPILHARSEGGTLQIQSQGLISVATVLADEHVLFTGERDTKWQAVFNRIHEESVPLGEIAFVNFGKQLRDRKKYEQDVIEIPVSGKVPADYKRCYTGEDVTRYHLSWGNLACLDSEEARCGGCWDPTKQNAKNKLLTRQIGIFPEFGLDRHGYQCLNTIFMVNVRENACDFRFLLGVLNSAVLRAYWSNRFYDQRRTFPKIKGTYLEEMPIKLAKSKAENATSKQIIKLVDEVLLAHERSDDAPRLINQKIAHATRTPCNLAHYLQKDFAAAVKAEILIDDVQCAGFIHEIHVEPHGKELTLTATVSDKPDGAPHPLPVVKLAFKDDALRQFVYACWRQMLAGHSRQKRWTKGKKPEPIYPLVVNTLEPLVYFSPSAGDNLQAIGELMKAVAKEGGSSDLAALESEIARLDGEIDERVYELYGLTEEEIRMVEGAAPAQ